MGILNDSVKQKGFISVSILSGGEIREMWESKNLIVDSGLTIFPLILQNKSISSISIKYGLNSTAPAVSQTNLLTLAVEDSLATATASNNSFIITSVKSITSPLLLKEFGMFINSIMYSRVVNVSGLQVNANETLLTTWTITLTRG